ncbi:hypothetical protein TL16_g04596 [Triparma laevis f. inornata]|uniref:Uncharacterized protein n=1 Tax=Triparma laevis f. inornata TaxID=1714386 RepID=A0A9W7ACY0_9STRA|nr:hypothetical protein TL16_g04596 [Triparma laevis f. inornata]
MSNCSLTTNSYIYELCTNNGVCSNDSCICDEGWSGAGDFLNMEGEDCHVHTPTIKVLHGFCLVLVIINLCLTLSQVVPDALRAFIPKWAPIGSSTNPSKASPKRSIKKMAPPGQSKPAIFKAESFGKPLGFAVFQDTFFAGKSLNLISACGYMGFNLLHLTTDQNVGSDLPVTLCNGIGAIFFWACVFTKLYAIVSLSCKSSGLKSDELKNHLKRYKYSSFVCFFFVLCANCLTFLMLGGQSYQKLGVPGYYMLTGSSIVGVQINCKIYGGMIIKTMEDINKGKTGGPIFKQIQKFKLMVTIIVKRTTGTVIINFFFACIPWLHSKAVYQLPFQWAIAQTMLIVVYLKIIPKQNVKLKLKHIKVQSGAHSAVQEGGEGSEEGLEKGA